MKMITYLDAYIFDRIINAQNNNNIFVYLSSLPHLGELNHLT
jgi:hypothetical protein